MSIRNKLVKKNFLKKNFPKKNRLKKKTKRNKLTHELLWIFAITALFFFFLFFFLSTASYSIAESYFERNDIVVSESLEWTIDLWIQNVSLTASLLIAAVLLLFLIGRKLSYLKKIILGIEALRTHRMNHRIPLEGNNEITELAESINYLSQTELELKEREASLQKEKEDFLRSLSHDIRTPLTSILSYSEYMNGKNVFTESEIKEYASLINKKAQQIKFLTEQLLDGQNRRLEHFEDGRFLLIQLADEWEASLEDSFRCQLDFANCSAFSGEFDILELQRIFDNLTSNIRKYADTSQPVQLKIYTLADAVYIEQSNVCQKSLADVESNRIGIDNIRRIAHSYNGDVQVKFSEGYFHIQISFRNIRVIL